MNPTIPKFNASATTIKLTVECWNYNPGRWIMSQSKTLQIANATFHQFVTRKMPDALKLVEQLNNTGHLSASHLPLTIYSIFLIYIAEQIELYQNQMDERDTAVDEKFAQFKEAFAKERYHLFTHNPKWADVFFKDLRDSLAKADSLPKDFDETLCLWLKLISIVHVGDIRLASCFHPEARSPLLLPAKATSADLQRDTLEASFYLIVNQLSLNFKGVEKLKDKMAFPSDAEKQKLFFGFTDTLDIDSRLQNVSTYENASSVILNIKECAKGLLSVDLKDNQAIDKSLQELRNISNHINCYGDLSSCFDQLQETETRKEWPVKVMVQSKIVSVSKETIQTLLSFVQNRHDSHLFFDCYLVPHVLLLTNILTYFMESNKDIEKFYKEGIMPPSNPKPLLPPPALSNYSETAFRELYATPIPEPQPTTTRTKKKKGVAKAQSVAPQKTQKEPILPAPQIIPVEPLQAAALDSLEQLRRQLLAIYHTQPSAALRQAVWHLDKLITLKETLKTPAMNKEGLTVLNLATSSAHKLLEQTYSFCLANRNIRPLSSHNLKNYERALGNSSFPEIVQQLHLGNNWPRYFYLEKRKWEFSTQVVTVPALLQDLVDSADGKVQQKNPIGQKALDMIEKTRAHVETLLPQLNIDLPLEYLAEDVSIQPKLRFSPGNFNKVKTELTTFLTQSKLPPHHPAYLHIKQAIAALNILKGSLQAVQVAKTPRELATWVPLCVQQVHEALEDVLCGIEGLREGQVTSLSHDLKKLAAKLGLEMGELADACDHLSYKSRYPAENLSSGLASQIIDDVEALRQFPGYLDGFKLVGKSPLLWKQPEKDPTLVGVMEKLCTLLKSTQVFLEVKAIPGLQQR